MFCSITEVLDDIKSIERTFFFVEEGEKKTSVLIPDFQPKNGFDILINLSLISFDDGNTRKEYKT